MQRRLRQVFSALREHSSVSYAKIATVGGFCNVELIIIKATAPDDLPLPERYVQELLKIFSISPSSLRDFSLSFNRRFVKTRCWRVALKCLILLHRLLRSVPEDSNFRSELLWTRSNGLMSLNQCHFRDDSSSASKDYTAFIRSYARLLDEALHCFWLDSKPAYDQQDQQQYEEYQYREQDEEYKEEGEEEEPQLESLSNRMTEVGRILEVLPHLQTLIDLVMDCRPTGPAAKAFLVQLAMKHIIRESFMCYTIFRREIVTVLDSMLQMPYSSCISAFGIYKKAAVQANQLSEFYEWCKAMGFCGGYEYPFIDQIPHIQIHALEKFLNGMWQLTESSSTPTSPTSSASVPSSFVEFSSSTTLTEDDIGDRVFLSQKDHILVSTKWEKPLIRFERESYDEEKLLIQLDEEKPLIQFEIEVFDKEKPLIQFDEEKPLIDFEDDIDNESWESLLEASINKSPAAQTQQNISWQMQIYNPNALNPFHQPVIRPNYHGDYNVWCAQI
ncbi:hypothetical protein C1H46_024006 [Malus baccata]|uniref:ENTH domain-containing protein n=1 Tax=Malus baccata TaxID=106549 RepID=A0A540LVE9_MALBA|nr:hypothetical protein C1H46_024006 [Malus baccata]